MMQDGSRDKSEDTSDIRTPKINEGSLAPSLLETVRKSQVVTSQLDFGPDMSGSDDDEASEVDSFILDENDMEGSEEVLEPPKFLLAAETDGGQQQLQTVDPETHARLEALLEAAGISKLSSKDGKALTDPEVLRTLTSSVSSALDEATQAINCMRSEHHNQVQGAEGTQTLNDRDASTVRKLYESGSVPDTTEEGESLLSLACSAGYYELAQVLLAMNANVEDRGIKGDCTPLMEAASGGFVDIVRLLILHGADVNAQSSAGNTPLHSAACAGHTNVVKELIGHGASVEVHNENGHTPLMEAASAGHVEIAQQLLEAGAGINTHSNEFKESALTLACYKGHLEMVKYLLDAGADQEHKTDEMHTALMEASMDGHVEVARLLLDSGAQVNMPVDSFESPLTLAACGGHVELANLLIERGANIEEVNDEGYTPLMEAAREGHEEMVALLLSHGADINAQTEETQETALTLACCGGFQDVVEFLIKAGADIELGCSTPLMEAAQEGHLELVRFLLAASANVHAQTGTNDTALTYACENGHTDVAQELLGHGGYLEHESEGGRTPLMKSARAGHLCTVKFLIGRGADVNRATSTNDHTVLSLACAGGHHQVVECLLNNGADVNHKLKDGSTMIIEAAKGGHTNVVKMLLEWPNRLMLNSNVDLAQPDMPHVNMAQTSLEEPRVPVQGLAHIVPPNEPDSQLPTCLNMNSTLGKSPERLNGGKILGKRTLSASGVGVESKLLGKTNNSVIAENLQQINHEGAMLADLTDEKATEKVEAIINNIMAKELMGPSTGSKEEQLQRKQQILEELQKVNKHQYVEKELQEKAQAQQHLEHQQQLLKVRSTSCATPSAVRQAEETAKRVMELNVAAGASGVQRGLAESLCLTGTQAMDSLPLKDLVVQLPKLLSNPDLAAATQSLIPNPAYATSEPFLQCSSSLSSIPSSIPLITAGVSGTQQVQPPAPQFLQQSVPCTVVTNGNTAAAGNTAGKGVKGRNTTGKIGRNNKFSQQQQQTPLSQSLPQQQSAAVQSSRSLSPQSAPLALSLQTEHIGGLHVQEMELSTKSQVHVSAESVQQHHHQQLTAISQQQQQQQLQQLAFPQLTTQQQEQLLQHMLTQQVLQPPVNQPFFQQPLHQLLPQVQQETQQSPQMLTQQERAQLFHQTHQAQLLQHQLLRQTSSSAAPIAAAAPIPNPTSVVSSVSADKLQQNNIYQSSLDVDSQTESNHDTALTLACAGGHSELVSLLLAKGADIEHRDKKGFTPLILGATAGHLEVVEILLDHSADIEAQSERTKDTPLSLACSGGRYEVVELLLTKGANKEHRNVSDYTPLSLAASGGYVNIIKLLLTHGAEINSRTGSKLGISPLMLAAMNGHTQAVKLLLDMGSDINAQIETNRNTALTLACFQGRHEVVSLLVDRKANIEHRAKTGLTPLMEAASGGYVEVGRVLLDKGADVNAPPVPSSRDTALTIAADKGHYRFVELLLHRTASVDVKNKKGNSPLWLACNGGHLDVVQLLVTAGADIDSQDNRKVSCLMAAFRKGHIKVVKWMVKHVSQFPSDTELQRFISTVADKDLQRKCQQCMDNIVSAKDRQAAEATKNANSLLQEIDRERELDEQKRQIAAKRRERRKERKKKGKLEKSKDKDKTSSPEPESETGMNDQDEDEDYDSVQVTAPSATITSTIGTSLINTEAKTSRGNSTSITTNIMYPVVKVHTVVSSPSSSSISSTITEKRLHKAEIRKNRRNRKDKLIDFVVSKENASSGTSKVSTVTSSASNSLMTNMTEKTGHYSNCASSESGGFTVNNAEPNANSTQSSNSKRKRNDIIKPAGIAKSRVEDLDDFALNTSKSLMPPKEVDRLSKVTERLKMSASDTFNVSDRESNVMTKLSPLGTSPRKGPRKDDGWKEVTRNCNSRSKKVTVHASVISRVIGRGGCNINSIREASSAHVDIEKPQKGVVDRVITIKGSAEATRMAHAMITSLIQEPDRELADIITRVKGKSTEKVQQAPESIGDFSIGTFSNTTSSNHSNSNSSQKSSAKSGSARQATSSSAVVNGRPTAITNAGVPQSNVWQNSSPNAGVPCSPRRSPQKQLPQSFIIQTTTSSGPTSSPDKIIRQVFVTDASRISLNTPVTSNTPVVFGTPTSIAKSSPTPVALRTSATENRLTQVMSSSIAGSSCQKAVSRQAGSNIRVLQRQTPGVSRADLQPLPIVSSHMSSSTGSSPASSSTNQTMTSSNFSAFHLWNNSSPTPILSSKKEDFASVAAAGVVSTQPNQQAAQATSDTPTSLPNDPTKAPGYKAGMRTASPHSRQDQPSISSSLSYQLPMVNTEHPDIQMLGFRGVLPSAPGISPHPVLPCPAGDGNHISPHMTYPLQGEHPGGFPNQHANYSHLHCLHPGFGSLVDQKEEYSTPHQPMTLPEIKSTLNPNAPDFRITGTGGNGPVGFLNGYLPTMGDLHNSGDLSSSGCAGHSEDAGVNSNLNQMQVLAQLQQAVTAPGFMQMMAQQLINMDMLQQMQQQQRSTSPSPQVASTGPGPGPPSHLGVHDTTGCSHSLPCPVPGPTPPALPNFMTPQGLVRSVSPMPSQHRPNSAPSMADAASVPSIRPSNIGPPMSACTPPLLESNTEDRRVIRPIGGERAVHRKTPVTSASSSGLGGSGDFNTGWSVPEMTKEWMSSPSPQMTAAALPTSVITSSVVTGSNMAYTLSQRENPAPAPGSDSISGFHESYNSNVDSTDTTVQTWRNNWSRTDM